MFEVLTKGFRAARARLQGQAVITEAGIDSALKDIRVSLLEADVALHVVNAFLEHVKEKALGEVVRVKVSHKGEHLAISPADHFVKLCHDELIAIMGSGERGLNLETRNGPATIMMVGLHGTGKTTSAAKLASLLIEQKRRPMLVAADVYRPAAIAQLQRLGERLQVPVYTQEGVAPPKLCADAILAAVEQKRDVIIFDTAGRLALDEPLMNELSQIKTAVKPQNILLVVDAMIGQDSVRMASEFDRRLDLSGLVLTKMDGDARGGAALSIKAVTGKDILFVGMGEDLGKMESFRPDGIATRILGFGDVVGLVKDFEKVTDEKQAEADAIKILKGEFNLYQFLEQIRAIQKMGSLRDTLEKLPFFHEMVPDGAAVDEKVLSRIEAMINSMTPDERTHPERIDDKRVARIARGSGRKPSEVKDLLARFSAMKEMMKRVGKQPSLLSRLPGFREALQLAKSRGEDVSDMMPPEKGSGFGSAYGVRRLSQAEKDRRRRKEKLAKSMRQKSRKRR